MADSYVGYSPADRLSLANGSVTVGALATTGTASSSTYLRGDMAWSSNPLGDVTGPGSSTDDALAKFDATTGKIIQNSNATLTDAGVLTVSNIAATINTATQNSVTTMTGLTTIGTVIAGQFGTDAAPLTAYVNAGEIDGAVIGSETPAAITGTAITGTQVDITAQGDLRLQDTTGGQYVAIQAAGTTTTYTLTMPGAVATTTGQALTSTTAGAASWSDVGDASKGTANEWTAQQNFNNTTLVFDATQDWALAANQVATLTLTANTIFDAPTQMVDGAFYSLIIIQDGTGGWTASWNAVFKWAAGTAPTLTTTASAKDIFVWRSDGTNMYEVGRQLNVS